MIPSTGVGENETPLKLSHAVSIACLNGAADVDLSYARFITIRPFMRHIERVGNAGSRDARIQMKVDATLEDLSFSGLILPAGQEWFDNNAELKLALLKHFTSDPLSESIAAKIIRAETLATAAVPEEELLNWLKQVAESFAENEDTTIQALHEAEALFNQTATEQEETLAKSVAALRKARAGQEPARVQKLIEQYLDQDRELAESLEAALQNETKLLTEPFSSLRKRSAAVGHD
ncbi:MAG: hypothetical protein R3C01_10875 [Planctomycetaceae bacterium]